MEQVSQSDEVVFAAVLRSLRDRILYKPYIGKSPVNFAYVADSLRPRYVGYVVSIHRTSTGEVRIPAVVDQIVQTVMDLQSRFGIVIPELVVGLVLEMDVRYGATKSEDIYRAVLETVRESKKLLEKSGVPLGVSTLAERFIMDVAPALKGMLEIILEQAEEKYLYGERLREILRRALLASERHNKDRFGLQELEKLLFS